MGRVKVGEGLDPFIRELIFRFACFDGGNGNGV